MMGHSVPARQWFFSDHELLPASCSLAAQLFCPWAHPSDTKWRPRSHCLEPSCRGTSCSTDIFWLFFRSFSYSGVVPGSNCVLGVCDAIPALSPWGPPAMASLSCFAHSHPATHPRVRFPHFISQLQLGKHTFCYGRVTCLPAWLACVSLESMQPQFKSLSCAGTGVMVSSEAGQCHSPSTALGVLTGDEAPQVQPHGAVQCLVGAAKSIEHEEPCSHQSKDNQYCTEENDTNVDTCRDNFEQIWKN